MNPDHATPAITRSKLAAQLLALGLEPGETLIVHTRMSAIGWVVGGAETVIRALLDVLGPRGTLCAYASWEEHVYHAEEWAPEHRRAYLAEPPAFDPRTAEAVREHGRVPERLRTWPSAQRSVHPEASVVAVGPRAAWIVDPHEDGYGPASPFARLVEAGARVLILGAPLETITMLHHAEAIAAAEPKRRVAFRVAVAGPDGEAIERLYEEIETSAGAYAYERLGLDADEFEVIAREALAAGIGTSGRVGLAECRLFDAAALVSFAVAWIERRFGAG